MNTTLELALKNILILIITLLISSCAKLPHIERNNYYVWEKDYGVDSDAIVKQVIYTTDIETMKAHT